MQETSNSSRHLARWFSRQQRATSQQMYLHHLIFGDDLLRYFLYRTRYTLAIALLRMGLHLIEFGLLAYAMPTMMYQAMIIRLLSLLAESGWWGMLDAMRHRIRALSRQRDLVGIQREIQGWLTWALVLALLIIGVATAAAVGKTIYSWPFALLVLAIGIQTGVRLISRTFYSGAYAIRRIFFPIELIMLPEIGIFLLGILCYPKLGEWTVPVSILLATLVNAAISYRLVRHVTDFLRITPSKFFSKRTLAHVWVFHRPLLLVRPAVAAFAMRAHDLILVLSLQALAMNDLASHAAQKVLFALYLVLPFFRSCLNWAQVMYFDLSRYHLDVFARFRSTLERLGFLYSLLLAVVFGLLSALVTWSFAASIFGVTVWVILPYMMVSAVYSFALVSLFSRRRYSLVAALCLMQYGLLWLLLVHQTGHLPIVAALALSLLPSLLLGWWQLRRRWQPPSETITSYLPWVASLCRRRQPTALMRLFFHPTAPRDFAKQVARDMVLADENVSLCIGHRVLLVAFDWQREQENERRESMLRYGRGFTVKFDAVHGESGREAYKQALASGMLMLPPDGETIEGGLIEEFRRRFPTGLVQHPMRRQSAVAAATTSQERRVILQDARHSADLRARRHSEQWYVTSAFSDPFVAVIFLVPKKDVLHDAHVAWQQFLDRYNLAALHAQMGITG